MSEESSETSLTELAVETFGTEFHLDPRIEKPDQVEQDQSIELRTTVEQEPERREPQKDDAVWSNGDLQTITALQREASQFQTDLQKFAQAKQIDLNALEKQDRGRAAALRAHLREAEKELRERYDVIARAAGSLNQRIAEKHLETEWHQLIEQVPDLDNAKLTPYLQTMFTDSEIAAAADHRLLVLAEKARRYDEAQAKPAPKGVILTKVKREPQTDPEYQAAISQVREGAGLRENASILMRKQPQARPRSVSDLSRSLRKTGSIDDAYALLQAKKQRAS